MKKVKCILLILLVMVITSCQKNEKRESTEDKVTISATPTSVVATTTVTETPSVAPVVEVISTSIYTKEDGSLSFPVQSIDETKEYEAPFMTKEEFPVIDGSTANIPLGEAIYCYLTKATKEEAAKDLHFYTTPDSYRRLINHEADLLFVYEPSQVVLQEMMDANAQLEFKPLGRDALVFIENDTNPVTSLTQQQITDIYTGKTKNWSEVGGEDLEILPFQRPETSGSQTLMEKLAVPKDQLLQGPQVSRPTEMGELIDVLASYNNESNALGYSVFFYANYMYNKPGLRFVAIDHVMPTNETIQSGEYPYVNDFYVVIRANEEKDSKARQIYDWMTTKEAQTILQTSGYVPILAVGSEELEDHTTGVKGALKLMEDQYFILHNQNPEGAFLGDSIYDKNFKEIITFPGKQIVCGNNQTCQKDEVLILKTYEKEQVEYSSLALNYELYSLKEKKIITTSLFHYIEKKNEIYYCYNNDPKKGDNIEACYNVTGKLICNIEYDPDKYDRLFVVKNHVARIQDHRMFIYDSMGNQLKTITLSEGSAGYDVYDNERLGYEYLCINDLDTNRTLLYDANGKEIDLKSFLPKKDQAKITDAWIDKVVKGTDGHLYVAGRINHQLVIAKDDQTIIWRQENDNETYQVTLYPNLFFLSPDGQWDEKMVLTLDGTVLNPEQSFLPYTNDCVILQKENGFDVIAINEDIRYFVTDKKYKKDAFYPSESMLTSPKLTIYYREGEENQPYSSFLGKRTLIGHSNYHQIDDTYSWLESFRYIDANDLNYERIDSILNEEGSICYKGTNGEVVTGAIVGEELYVILEKGNYMEICDLDGKTLYRQYSNRLSDD